jgi:hypothetical protein
MEPSWMGVVPFYNRPKDFVCPSRYVRTQWEGALTRLLNFWCLGLGLPVFRTVNIFFLMFLKHQFMVFYHSRVDAWLFFLCKAERSVLYCRKRKKTLVKNIIYSMSFLSYFNIQNSNTLDFLSWGIAKFKTFFCSAGDWTKGVVHVGKPSTTEPYFQPKI